MTDLHMLLLWGVSPFILTAVLTGWFIQACKRQQWLDTPNTRSSHSMPTPRGGGMVFGTFIALLYGLYGYLTQNIWVLTVADFMAAFVLLGVLDDRFNLPARMRIVLQMILVGLALSLLVPQNFTYLHSFFPFSITSIAVFAVLFFGLIWFINLYNFMDGIDGISAVQTLSLLIGLILLSPIDMVFLVIPIACVLGFLVWNWPPAGIFMGDSGSISLGFLIGMMLILVAGTGPEGFLTALILPLYYLCDASLTLVKRVIRREKFWQAHRGHFYQKATTTDKNTHRFAVLCLVACNIALFGCAALVPVLGVWALLAAFVPVGITLTVFARKGRR